MPWPRPSLIGVTVSGIKFKQRHRILNSVRFLSYHLLPLSSIPQRPFNHVDTHPDLTSYGERTPDTIDDYGLVRRIRESTKQSQVFHGQQLHSLTLQAGLLSNVYVSTALVSLYVRLVSVPDAYKLFDEIPTKNVVTWNSMICGSVHSGEFSQALRFFIDLSRTELPLDGFSYTAALAAVGRLHLLRLGTSMHSHIVRSGMETTVVIANCLIDMYGRCGAVQAAVDVFTGMMEKDVISWNSILAACARNTRSDLAVQYFDLMPYRDTISYNELINCIAQSGNMEEAVGILESMPEPNSSSWNSVITGFVNRNKPKEALDIFSSMKLASVEMDEYTFSSCLSGVARLSALTWGMLLHCHAVKQGLEESVVVGSAVVDMYSKCGQVKMAESVFESLPCKNSVTWNAMISGFAHNGESEKAIRYFEELKQTGGDSKPDEITFLNVLAACSHNLVPFETAYQCFVSMVGDSEIVPTVEHVTAMIRIMGQQGEVWRAEKMIEEFGFGECGVVWRALLGACQTCEDLEVARVAGEKVIELEGDHEFVYVVLSNINASYGKWDEMAEVREVMRKNCVEKDAGFSWVET